MTGISYLFVLIAGYAMCWFTKDFTVKQYTGAAAFAAKLEAKAKALRAVL